MHTSTGSGSALPARAGKPKAGLRRRRARQWPGRLLRVMGSAAAFASAAAAMAAFASGPSGASSPSGAVTVSPGDGPVGTVVRVLGHVAPACRPSSGTVEVTLERVGQAELGGVTSVWTPVLGNGSFDLQYQIPTDLGGTATRGLYAWPVSSGTYQFQFVGTSGCGMSTPGLFQVTGRASPSPSTFVAIATTPNGKAYWLAQAGGGVYTFGDAGYFGSLPGIGVVPAQPIVGIASTPDGRGYWMVGADGGVFAFGDAGYYGSLPGSRITPNAPITSIAPTGDGRGYWLLGADGGVFTFGDAGFEGRQTTANAPYVSISALGGGGYAVATASPGQIWAEPSGARLSTLPFFSPFPLAASISGAATLATGSGSWQVGLDGGVFTFGRAPFEGSLPGAGIRPSAPIVAIAATADGGGYWLLGSDGGVFTFGDAGFYGSGA
jgi:hypothetical protein